MSLRAWYGGGEATELRQSVPAIVGNSPVVSPPTTVPKRADTLGMDEV